ncbi:MAG: hypothetical protein ABIN13_07295 [Mucilaginibacter sp.]
MIAKRGDTGTPSLQAPALHTSRQKAKNIYRLIPTRQPAKSINIDNFGSSQIEPDV